VINYCPECGIKIDKEYKYCPNCGTELKSRVFETKTAIKGPVIVCANCGEENAADSYECSSCGIALRKGKPEKKQNKMKPAGKSSVKQTVEGKSLDMSKLIPIFAGLIGIVLVILIATGAFESKVETPVQVTQSGVDLSAVQQINDLEKRVQAEPDNIQLLLDLAHLKNDSGFYDRAIEDYKRYLEKNPSNPDARIDMGVCYYNLRQYDTAIQEMKKALEYKPDHQIGHLNLGIVNLAAGNMEESRMWLQKAVDLGPDNQVGLRAKELLSNH
jgi:tetratricopeptide (TPR) repeat protein